MARSQATDIGSALYDPPRTTTRTRQGIKKLASSCETGEPNETAYNFCTPTIAVSGSRRKSGEPSQTKASNENPLEHLSSRGDHQRSAKPGQHTRPTGSAAR